jgi:hypothetical protein
MAYAAVKGRAPCIYPACHDCTLEKDADCRMLIGLKLIDLKNEYVMGHTDERKAELKRRIDALVAVLKAGGETGGSYTCAKCGGKGDAVDALKCLGCGKQFCKKCYDANKHVGCCAHE